MAMITCAVCRLEGLDDEIGVCPRCGRDPVPSDSLPALSAAPTRGECAADARPPMRYPCGCPHANGFDTCPYCGPIGGVPCAWTVRVDDAVLTIPADGLTLGRADPVTGALLATRDTVSRRHALLRAQPDGVLVTDLASTNGTFVDGARVTPDAPLLARAGSEIELGREGRVQFRVAASGAAMDEGSTDGFR